MGISLPEHLYPTSVTIDYVPLARIEENGRAPRTMRLWGALEGAANEEQYASAVITSASFWRQDTAPPIMSGDNFALLAEFEYDIYAANHVQTFAIFRHIQDTKLTFGVYVLEVVDNWGKDETCIHRVRLHGRAVKNG